MAHDSAKRAVMGRATENGDDNLHIENLAVLQE